MTTLCNDESSFCDWSLGGTSQATTSTLRDLLFTILSEELQHRVLFVQDGAPLCFTWYMKQFLDPHYPDRWIAQNRQFSLSVSHLTTCVRGVICRAQFTEAELTRRRSFGVWLRRLRQYGTWPAGTGNSWCQSSVLCTQANGEYFKLLL